MKRNNNFGRTGKFRLGLIALVPAVIVPLPAHPQPFMQAGTSQPPPPLPSPKAAAPVAAGTNAPAAAAAFSNPVGKFFNGEIPDALAHGKFNLNVRLRYEQVDDDRRSGHHQPFLRAHHPHAVWLHHRAALRFSRDARRRERLGDRAGA